uniref:CD109 molecule n=1 Tax=Electrophorus electricus TaxID=8005 RepID=A0A4W4F669_ELEEL
MRSEIKRDNQNTSENKTDITRIPEDDWSYLYPYKLIVTGYIGDTLIFANSTVLHSSPRNMSILLQTDKPGYRPEESVKIRAVVISPNGKPCDEDIDLDPRGNIVQQWLSMDTVLGTVDKEFQLSQNPPLGRWKIVATANVSLNFPDIHFLWLHNIINMYCFKLKPSFHFFGYHLSFCAVGSGQWLVSIVMSRYGLEFQQYDPIIKPSLNFSAQVHWTFLDKCFVYTSAHQGIYIMIYYKPTICIVTVRGQVVAVGTLNSSLFVLSPTVSWIPLANVLVYLIRSDGEVINAALDISFTRILRNDVSLRWEKDRAEPSQVVSLSVSVLEADSLVGILVVDKGSKDSDRSNDITEEEKQTDRQTERERVISKFSSSLCPLYYSISTTESFPLTVPNSMMSWVATAFVISKNLGLGLSAPVELEVFKHFFLYLNLPPYIIRGEVLLLEVSIFNRVDWHLEVSSTLYTAIATHRVRVWGKSHATVFFPIRATELGHMPISLRALALYTSDSVFHTILVKVTEGFLQPFYRYKISVYFVNLNKHYLGTTLSRDLEFHFPAAVVEGSQRAQVTVVGDILGPSISGLDSLIQMPCGCGEQNMVYFAPAVYVLQYLSRVGQLDEETLSRALGYMEQGYQRELSYQRLDGSFSAFGDIDPSGSTWLTAFVLKCFVQAQPFIFIDTAVLTKAAGWLRAQQTPTGAFQEPGRVIHTQLLDGLGGQLSLTAYVLVAVLEDPEYTNIFAGQISGAVDYLTFKLKQGISSSYSLCLVTYALTLAHSPFAGTALTELMNRAQVHDGVPMWSSPDDSLATSWQPPTADIEMAAYVLLTLYRQGIPEQGYALMKWLLQQRNYMGGFGSTQDTVIALQALSAYATLSSSEQINLAIRVTSATATVASFTVDRNNYLQYQSQEVAVSIRHVSASGRGFALFQLTTFYNIEAQEMTHRLHDAYTHEAFDLLKENKVVNQTSMTILEVGLLTGFGLAQEGIPLNDLVRRVETSPGKVILYLDSVKTTDASVLIPTTLEFKVTGVQEAAVVIYDYYEPRKPLSLLAGQRERHSNDVSIICWNRDLMFERLL